MICSISTGKCGSNWLDRLRSNKGFPVGDDLELDHFLESKDTNPESNTSESTQNQKVATEICDENENENENGDDKGEWFGVMNNVLSDLFIMGESNQSCKFSRKQNSRKQTNPKFCLVSSMTSNIEEEQELEQNSGWCVRKDENVQTENELKEEVEEECVNCVEMEDGEREELLGYSRNEVTVIDTSCKEWKFEKLVYRKRNMWKVREKRGKSHVIGLGRKKRKANGSVADATVDAKKKLKLSSQEDCIFSSKHRPQVEEGEEVRKETSEYHNKGPKKRLLLSRLPKKAKKGGKSAILRKGMFTNKKNIAKCPKIPSLNCGIEKPRVACNKALSVAFSVGEGFWD